MFIVISQTPFYYLFWKITLFGFWIPVLSAIINHKQHISYKALKDIHFSLICTDSLHYEGPHRLRFWRVVVKPISELNKLNIFNKFM